MRKTRKPNLAFNNRDMTTKTITALLATLALATTSVAQKSKITTAGFALQEGDLAKAKELLDEATVHVKTASNAKGWYYYADTYWRIFVARIDSSNFWDLDPDPLPKAELGYNNAIKFGNGGTFATQAQTIGLQNIYQGYAMKGDDLRTVDDYDGAFQSYGTALDIYKRMTEALGSSAKDTVLMFTYAYSAQRSDQTEVAIEKYEELVAMNMQDALLYNLLANLYRDEEMYAEAKVAVNKGLEVFPTNSDLIITKLNIYLSAGEQEEAVEEFEEAARLEADNIDIIYALGTIYDKLMTDAQDSGQTETADGYRVKAIATYELALGIEADHHGSNYNVGVIYYNDGVEIAKQMNALPREAQSEWEKLDKERAAKFEQALPYLEKALESKPGDKPTTNALKEIYVRLKMYDKVKDLEEG